MLHVGFPFCRYLPNGSSSRAANSHYVFGEGFLPGHRKPSYKKQQKNVDRNIK